MQPKDRPSIHFTRNPLIGGLLLTSLLGPAQGLADEGSSIEKAVEYRQSVMEIFKWNRGALGAMTNGKQPYDATAFEGHARDLIAAGRLDLLAGFPEDSVHEDSSAMSEIWLDWEGFEARLQDLRKALDGLEASLAQAELEPRKAALDDVGKACKGCHQQYKE